MSSPTFIVLDDDYSAAEITRLLGVIVTDVGKPFKSRFSPALKNGEKLQFIDNYRLSAKREEKVTIKTSAIRGTSAEVSLTSIFGLSGKWNTIDNYTLTSNNVQTVSIERPEDAFEELMEIHGKQILRERRGVYYFGICGMYI